jgi:hypothetical protein
MAIDESAAEQLVHTRPLQTRGIGHSGVPIGVYSQQDCIIKGGEPPVNESGPRQLPKGAGLRFTARDGVVPGRSVNW